jgi:hypothetical protein
MKTFDERHDEQKIFLVIKSALFEATLMTRKKAKKALSTRKHYICFGLCIH